MRIGFRAGVFVAKSVSQSQARRRFPFVLREGRILFLVLVAGSFRVFTKFIHCSEKQIREIVSGTDPAGANSTGAIKIEDAVGLVGVNRILLHDPEAPAELEGMLSAI